MKPRSYTPLPLVLRPEPMLARPNCVGPTVVPRLKPRNQPEP